MILYGSEWIAAFEQHDVANSFCLLTTRLGSNIAAEIEKSIWNKCDLADQLGAMVDEVARQLGSPAP